MSGVWLAREKRAETGPRSRAGRGIASQPAARAAVPTA